MKEYIERAHLLKNLGYDDCDELMSFLGQRLILF